MCSTLQESKVMLLLLCVVVVVYCCCCVVYYGYITCVTQVKKFYYGYITCVTQVKKLFINDHYIYISGPLPCVCLASSVVEHLSNMLNSNMLIFCKVASSILTWGAHIFAGADTA